MPITKTEPGAAPPAYQLTAEDIALIRTTPAWANQSDQQLQQAFTSGQITPRMLDSFRQRNAPAVGQQSGPLPGMPGGINYAAPPNSAPGAPATPPPAAAPDLTAANNFEQTLVNAGLTSQANLNTFIGRREALQRQLGAMGMPQDQIPQAPPQAQTISGRTINPQTGEVLPPQDRIGAGSSGGGQPVQPQVIPQAPAARTTGV